MISPKISSHTCAQLLLVAALISLMTSPPLANLFELPVFACVCILPSLRQRLVRFMIGPVGVWVLAFSAVLAAALIYGIAPTDTILQNLFSWRRLLLLPVAAALFMDDPDAKRTAAIAYLCVAAVFMLYSYTSYAIPTHFNWVNERGVVVRNHVTQGMFFSAAILVGIAALHAQWFTRTWQKGLCAGTVVLLFLNITLLMTGRSGYFALLIMLSTYVAANMTRHFHQLTLKASLHAVAVCSGVAAIVATTLVLSPVANQKLTQAYDEAIQVDLNTENNIYTSVGVRMMFWRTTIGMIPQHPLLGVGTAGFDLAYAHGAAGKTGLAGLLTGDPHNQYLKIAAEQGLLGLAIFIGLLINVARQSAQQPFKNLGICALLAWCATSLANAHFSTFSEGHFIWMWLGIMLAPDTAADAVSDPSCKSSANA